MTESSQATPATAPHYDNEMFVVEGVISDLEVAQGTENLFQQLDVHYKGKSAVAGVGAVVGGMYGQVANAALLAMYDGEDTENFICKIGDQVVCGTFGGASKLPQGNKVKAVVQKQGDVLVAKGILSEDKGFVWLSHAWGWKAERATNFKMAWWAYAFGMICLILFGAISGDLSKDSFWDLVQISLISLAVICFGLAYWNSSTMNAFADPATEVFRKFGFANPEKVNLNSYRYGVVYIHELVQKDESDSKHFNIHCYKKAIEDGKLKMASESGA